MSGRHAHTVQAAPLSIVIPTTRAGGDLIACLRSVEAQGHPQLEVIVVDNASPDQAIEQVIHQFPSVRLLRNEENRGFVGACNQGIEASTAELILLLNDDTILEPNALSAFFQALVDHPSWGGCQAKLLLMSDPRRLDTAGSFLTPTGFLVHRGSQELEDGFTESDEIFAGKGAALLLRRAALRDAGTFDPRFFAYFEESDLCWRLWLTGWKVGFAANARVLHKLGATSSEFPSALTQFHSFKNRICTLVKNLGLARLAWVLPYHLGLCLCLAGWYAARMRGSLSIAILRAIAWNVVALAGTIRARRQIQQRRRISDARLMPTIIRPTPMRTLFGYAQQTKLESKAGVRGEQLRL